MGQGHARSLPVNTLRDRRSRGRPRAGQSAVGPLPGQIHAMALRRTRGQIRPGGDPHPREVRANRASQNGDPFAQASRSRLGSGAPNSASPRTFPWTRAGPYIRRTGGGTEIPCGPTAPEWTAGRCVWRYRGGGLASAITSAPTRRSSAPRYTPSTRRFAY